MAIKMTKKPRLIVLLGLFLIALGQFPAMAQEDDYMDEPMDEPMEKPLPQGEVIDEEAPPGNFPPGQYDSGSEEPTPPEEGMYD